MLNVARLKNVNDSESMFTQQLENIFATLSAYISTSIQTSIPISKSTPRRRPRPKHIPESLPIDMDEFLKIEMTKSQTNVRN